MSRVYIYKDAKKVLLGNPEPTLKAKRVFIDMEYQKIIIDFGNDKQKELHFKDCNCISIWDNEYYG